MASQIDKDYKLIKTVEIDILDTLKLAGTEVTATAAELNALDGITASVAELNVLDGITSDVDELNILDGVTSDASELNILDGVTATAEDLNTVENQVADVAFVIGSPATVVNVALQLKDADGNDIAEISHIHAYLSDTITTGLGISGTAPATSVAIGADGAIIVEEVSKLAWWLQSEADGDIDLDITEVGAETWYMVVVLPNGKQIVSGAITTSA